MYNGKSVVMIIKLNDVLSVPDKAVEEDIELDFDSINIRGFDCAIKDATSLHYKLVNLGDNRCHIMIRCDLTIAVPCDRCLEDVDIPISIDYNEALNVSDDEDNQDLDDISYIREYQLDINMLIYEEVSLKLPMKILCKDDCLGICPVCGVNRNIKECTCDRKVPDPRMADALDMINDFFKEV
ncbi:MAG: DUF177 domain-containing protein [Lachnospiraceae bacterium]|nr:DUF177 domain-containing protein [Lachnospiraceae bacterium]